MGSECRVSGHAGSATDGSFCPPSRRVVITDCGATAFRQLLLWLYSGSIDPGLVAEDLASILRLADVYRLPALGLLCERELVVHIEVENVVALLQVAWPHVRTPWVTLASSSSWATCPRYAGIQ